jgi:Zn finger protein HypA/HybF involved in hydrogenase expression
MNQRHLDADHLMENEDWEGNNAAFSCPLCSKVFIVSGAKNMHGGRRICPGCRKSEARIEGGKKSGGRAWISWPLCEP